MKRKGYQNKSRSGKNTSQQASSQKYISICEDIKYNGIEKLSSKDYKELVSYELSRGCTITIHSLLNIGYHIENQVDFSRGQFAVDVRWKKATEDSIDFQTEHILTDSEIIECVYKIFEGGFRDDELVSFNLITSETCEELITSLQVPKIRIVFEDGCGPDELLTNPIMVDAIANNDQTVIEEISESINIYRMAYTNFFGNIKKDIVKLCYLTFINKQVAKNQIHSSKMDVLTKKAILDMSLGEIRECVSSGGHDVTEEDRIKNTIFNKVIFGGSDKHNRDSARYKNFGHIKLTLPIVHPDKYSSTRNYLMTMLGLSDGKTITELINYESFIMLPKDDKWSQAFKGEYDALLSNNTGRQSYSSKVQIPIFVQDAEKSKIYHDNGEEHLTYERKYLSFDVISYRLFADGEAKKLYPNLSNRSAWKSVLALTGAYAVVYLMAQLDIQDTIKKGNEFLKGKALIMSANGKALPESVQKVSAFIETLTNRTKDGDILDIVTDVISVIPAAYRDFNKVEEGGVVRIIQPPINMMYNSIIQKDIDIREKTHGRQYIPYEVFYELVKQNEKTKRLISSDSSIDVDTGEVIDKTSLLDKQRYLKSAIMAELEVLNFMGTGTSNVIMNIQTDIQSLLYKHIYSSGDPTSKNVAILDELGGKYGTIRDIALAKRVDYTARSVITPDPNLDLDEIGIPVSILIKWFNDIIVSTVQDAVSRNQIVIYNEKGESTKERIKKLMYKLGSAEEQPITTGDGTKARTKLEKHREESQAVEKIVMEKLREITKKLAVLGIRYPSLWRYNELGMLIVPVLDNTFHIHPLVCPAYNADFDGDTFSTWLAQIEASIKEIKELLLPSSNFMDTGGNALFKPTQDSVLGLYIMTMIEADDLEPNIDPQSMAEAYIANQLEDEKDEYMKKNNKTTISDAIVNRLVDKLRFRAYKELSIKPVIGYYNSYSEMHNDYILGKIKVSDKVSVKLPHYSISEFFNLYNQHTVLHQDIKVPTVDCVPIKFGGYDIENPLNIVGDLDTMCLVDKSLDEYPKLSSGTEIILKSNRPINTHPIVSTVGMFLLNTVIPQDLGIVVRNPEDKKSLYQLEIDYSYLRARKILGVDSNCIKDILLEVIDTCNREIAKYVHVKVMRMGFNQATKAGMSLSVGDLVPCPERDKIIEGYQTLVDNISETDAEKKNAEQIRLWTECTYKVQKATMDSLPHDNTLFLMSVSGARGNKEQITQILGMRGLLIDPAGNIIATPVKSAFIDGMSAMDSSISSYGAGKGMIDKANKTKDTGAFARTAMFGSSSVKIVSGDCGDTEGTWQYRIPFNYSNLDPNTGIGKLPTEDMTCECIIPNRTILVDGKLLLDDKGTLRMSERKQIFNINHWWAYNPGIIRQGEVVGAIKFVDIQNDNFAVKMIFFDKEFFVRSNDTNAQTCPDILVSGRVGNELATDKMYTLNMAVAVITNKIKVGEKTSIGNGFAVFTNVEGILEPEIWKGITSLEEFLDSPYKMYSEFKQHTDKYGVSYTDINRKDLISVIGGKLVNELGNSKEDDTINVFTTYKPGNPDRNELSVLNARTCDTELIYTEDFHKGLVVKNENNEILYNIFASADAVTEYLIYKVIQGDITLYPSKAIVLQTIMSFTPDIAYDGLYYHNNNSGKTVSLSKKDIYYSPQNYKLEMSHSKTMVQITTIADERLSTSIIEMTDIINKLTGHFTIQPIRDKYTDEILIKANSSIKKVDGVLNSTLKEINEQYPEGVFVRSVMTCKSPGSKCAKCYGYNHGFHRHARIGDLVSASAAHAMSEFLSQSTMRTFHTGGAAIGGDVADTFEATAGLLLHGRIDDVYIKSLLSEINKITTFEIECIENKVKQLESFYTRDQDGEPVFTGIEQKYAVVTYKPYDITMSRVTPNPRAGEVNLVACTEEPPTLTETSKFTGSYSDYNIINGEIPVTLENYGLAKLGEYREIYNSVLDKLVFIFKHSGKTILSSDIEIMASCVVQYVFVVSKGDSENVVASEVNRKDLIKQNIVLSLKGKKAFVVTPSFTNITNSASNSKEDPLLALGYQNAKKVLGDATMNARVINTINPIISPMVGTKMETGKNLDPEKYTRITDVVKDKVNNHIKIDKFIEKAVAHLISKQEERYKRNMPVNKVTEVPLILKEELMNENVDATSFSTIITEYPVLDSIPDYNTNTVEQQVEAEMFDSPVGEVLDEYDGSEEEDVEDDSSPNDLNQGVESISFGDNTADNIDYDTNNSLYVEEGFDVATEDADSDLGEII